MTLDLTMDFRYETKITNKNTNKFDLIKNFKNFYTLKDVKTLKSQSIEREKILANHISDKGLESRIYKKNSYDQQQKDKQAN